MKSDLVTLGHGSGGKLTNDLISGMIMPRHEDLIFDDAAVVEIDGVKLAFTTDSFVVNPCFFPGGDIGKLSVFGSVNDLAVQGARPLYISTSVIIEEGFPMDDLEIIFGSIAGAAKKAGISVVTGDTKVVNKGACDRIFINTAAIGKMIGTWVDSNRIEAGDDVIITGEIGMHGMAVLAKRYGFRTNGELESDCDELSTMILDLIGECGEAVKWMRDPTRGGVAAALNELVQGGGLVVELSQQAIPISAQALAVSEMLGIDLLTSACEGVAIIVIDSAYTKKALEIIRKHKQGKNSAVAGKIVREKTIEGAVLIDTVVGAKRIVVMPSGEQLPRIC